MAAVNVRKPARLPNHSIDESLVGVRGWGRATSRARRCAVPVGLLALALLLVAGTAGCVNRIRPPKNVADPVIVYVADHGKHSSLLLPDGDVLPAADGYVQYGFGDWVAFVENDNSMRSYLRAAFISARSALGREVHETTDPAQLRRRVAARRLEPVTVERSAANALRTDLERHWHARAAQAVDNRNVRMILVPYHGPNARYSLWNHCNHTTARWLRRLDCTVWRMAMFSSFRVS